MLKRTEGAAREWGVGGIVAWIGVAQRYFIEPRESELFAEDDGSVRAVYCQEGETWYSMRVRGRWRDRAA